MNICKYCTFEKKFLDEEKYDEIEIFRFIVKYAFYREYGMFDWSGRL